MKSNKKLAPTNIVIFGGTGDLTKRKLTPAFYNVYIDGWMPEKFAIIGVGRTKLDDDTYREHLHEGLVEFSRKGKPDDKEWEPFKATVSYFESNINDPAAYEGLGARLDALDQQWGSRANRLFYLSIGPQFIVSATTNINKYDLANVPESDRIVVEKPFGYNK